MTGAAYRLDAAYARADVEQVGPNAFNQASSAPGSLKAQGSSEILCKAALSEGLPNFQKTRIKTST